jgi:hypothetical protein
MCMAAMGTQRREATPNGGGSRAISPIAKESQKMRRLLSSDFMLLVEVGLNISCRT